MKTCLCLVAVLLYLPVRSQGHWLRPQRFYYSVRDLAKVQIITGDSLSNEQISAWVLRPGGEHLEKLKGAVTNDLIIVPLSETGTYILNTQTYSGKAGSNNSRAIHFNKAILQVSHDFSESVTRFCGFDLEIVPAENPSVSPEDIRHSGLPKVRFRVYRHQQPAAMLPVFYRYSLPDGTEKTESLQTNKKGWLSVIRYPGSCLLYTDIPASGNLPGLSASLSFEFSQFFNERPPAP